MTFNEFGDYTCTSSITYGWDMIESTGTLWFTDINGDLCTERANILTGGTFILESYESAKARGATILAELVGYGTNSDGQHVTQPSADTMQIAMKMAVKDADIDANHIGYVNGHGTATEKGDIAETHATEQALGKGTPISSLKSYLGHTLGACGSIEAWASINMMNDNWFAPTANLTEVDPNCGDLAYIQGNGLEKETDFVMSNNFAFGGINTSLIFKRFTD